MNKISQKMELRQQQSPQQVLQASLLQLNLPLLEQRILHELEINPALELVDIHNDAEIEELHEDQTEAEEEIEFEWEELLGMNDDYEYPKSKENKAEDFETPLANRETFSERIMKQLQDCDMSKKDLEAVIKSTALQPPWGGCASSRLDHELFFFRDFRPI